MDVFVHVGYMVKHPSPVRPREHQTPLSVAGYHKSDRSPLANRSLPPTFDMNVAQERYSPTKIFYLPTLNYTTSAFSGRFCPSSTLSILG